MRPYATSVNKTVVADTSKGHDSETDEGAEMSWEIFGMAPYKFYTASIDLNSASVAPL